MSSIELISLSHQDRIMLLDAASASIEHGLHAGQPLIVRLEGLPDRLCEPRATFVTVRIDGQLRGCMGDLVAREPLINDVARNAFAAAFRDPRFSRLTPDEFRRSQIRISILSPPEPLLCSDEADLLRQIRPGIDGLILEYGRMRGTLLPSVWENVTRRDRFVEHLKRKAGLPEEFWSSDIRMFRYTTESFCSENVSAEV